MAHKIQLFISALIVLFLSLGVYSADYSINQLYINSQDTSYTVNGEISCYCTGGGCYSTVPVEIKMVGNTPENSGFTQKISSFNCPTNGGSTPFNFGNTRFPPETFDLSAIILNRNFYPCTGACDLNTDGNRMYIDRGMTFIWSPGYTAPNTGVQIKCNACGANNYAMPTPYIDSSKWPTYCDSSMDVEVSIPIVGASVTVTCNPARSSITAVSVPTPDPTSSIPPGIHDIIAKVVGQDELRCYGNCEIKTTFTITQDKNGDVNGDVNGNINVLYGINKFTVTSDPMNVGDTITADIGCICSGSDCSANANVDTDVEVVGYSASAKTISCPTTTINNFNFGSFTLNNPGVYTAESSISNMLQCDPLKNCNATDDFTVVDNNNDINGDVNALYGITSFVIDPDPIYEGDPVAGKIRCDCTGADCPSASNVDIDISVIGQSSSNKTVTCPDGILTNFNLNPFVLNIAGTYSAKSIIINNSLCDPLKQCVRTDPFDVIPKDTNDMNGDTNKSVYKINNFNVTLQNGQSSFTAIISCACTPGSIPCASSVDADLEVWSGSLFYTGTVNCPVNSNTAKHNLTGNHNVSDPSYTALADISRHLPVGAVCDPMFCKVGVGGNALAGEQQSPEEIVKAVISHPTQGQVFSVNEPVIFSYVCSEPDNAARTFDFGDGDLQSVGDFMYHNYSTTGYHTGVLKVTGISGINDFDNVQFIISEETSAEGTLEGIIPFIGQLTGFASINSSGTSGVLSKISVTDTILGKPTMLSAFCSGTSNGKKSMVRYDIKDSSGGAVVDTGSFVCNKAVLTKDFTQQGSYSAVFSLDGMTKSASFNVYDKAIYCPK